MTIAPAYRRNGDFAGFALRAESGEFVGAVGTYRETIVLKQQIEAELEQEERETEQCVPTINL